MSDIECMLRHLAFTLENEKPKYRIAWDYDDSGYVIGYWVWTCNVAAINLKPSFYVSI